MRPPKQDSTVLVAGGCGFIGANVVRRLLDDGLSVRILDDLSTGRESYVSGLDVDVVRGDLLDSEVVHSALAGCSGVVHLVAATSVLESVADPHPSYTLNVGGTLGLLRAAVDAGVERFVFASSNAALGEHEPPLHEGIVPRPLSPNGASKLAAEAYCQSFQAAHGLGTVVLRFANAYGPFSGHKTSVVTKFVNRLAAGQPLTIYGDGNQTRDFVFVADVADAVARALASETASGVYHVGTGRETSVLELVDVLSEAAGVTPRLEHLPSLAGEIRRNYSSIERAHRELGFESRVALEEGLRTTVAWLRAPQSLRTA